MDGTYKLVVPITADGRSAEGIPNDRRVTELFRTALARAKPALYEIEKDADEERDVSGEKPAIVKELRTKLGAWWVLAHPATTPRARTTESERRAITYQ